MFLKILEPLRSYAAVTILQHLMGLAVGVMVYALARHRFGVRPWIAALAAVPVLYDGFQIELEHLILSDVLFEFLLVLATTLLLWDAKPGWRRCTLIGLILGVSATVRSQGLPFLALFAASSSSGGSAGAPSPAPSPPASSRSCCTAPGSTRATGSSR